MLPRDSGLWHQCVLGMRRLPSLLPHASACSSAVALTTSAISRAALALAAVRVAFTWCVALATR